MNAAREQRVELIERLRDNVPEALRELPVWLLWTRERRGDRVNKVPVCADGRNRCGTSDTAQDRARMVAFEAAAAALLRIDRAVGLGIALGAVPGAGIILSGIDFDGCYRDGRLDERVARIVEAAGSYAERSPSGVGVHALGTGDIGTAKKDDRGFEIYSGGRFFTVTGDRINGAGVADLTGAAALTRELFGAAPRSDGTAVTRSADGDGLIREGGRNDFLSREAYRLRKQGMTVEQILPVIQALNTTRCAPPLEDAEVREIVEGKRRVLPEAVTLEDFRAYMPTHSYIYAPTREMWSGASINSRIAPIEVAPGEKVSATVWLDRNRPVEQMTWAPGLPTVIEDRLVSGGGWIERPGCRTFNLYRPPEPLEGDPGEAGRWLELVQSVYPAEADHIVRWLAHRVQRPQEKINHALLLGGDEGIGKDTILEPVKDAVGSWNFEEASPPQVLGRFNGFIKSVILRVSESRDLGDVDRYALHEHLKTLIAAPPNVLRCDEKNLREHAVLNLTGVIITTNHADGVYIPEDSRRYFAAWSELTKAMRPAAYWQEMYRWYEDGGGKGHVAAYLRSLDLSGFDPKAPPPQTAAFWRFVNAGRAPEDAEIADALDRLTKSQGAKEWPPAVTVSMLATHANGSFMEWLQDRRNSRQIPHRLRSAGYVAVRNEGAVSGLWVIDGRRQVIYARREFSVCDRGAAAAKLLVAKPPRLNGGKGRR